MEALPLECSLTWQWHLQDTSKLWDSNILNKQPKEREKERERRANHLELLFLCLHYLTGALTHQLSCRRYCPTNWCSRLVGNGALRLSYCTVSLASGIRWGRSIGRCLGSEWKQLLPTIALILPPPSSQSLHFLSSSAISCHGALLHGSGRGKTIWQRPSALTGMKLSRWSLWIRWTEQVASSYMVIFWVPEGPPAYNISPLVPQITTLRDVSIGLSIISSRSPL